MTLQTDVDRYVSFCGIECDIQAERLMERVTTLINQKKGDNQWHRYFTYKLEQKAKMNHDDLFFIGAQMNTLTEFLQSTKDEIALDMLWRIEQQCC